MYVGNLSNFFFKEKSWLSKQPKFSIDSNKVNINNILKIKNQYYTFDTMTGKLKKINSNKISHKTFKENYKEEKNGFPEIKNNIQSNRNKNPFYNSNINIDTNFVNNSSINKFISLYHNKNDVKHKSKNYLDNTNNFYKSIKSENNFLNNSFSNSKEQDNNIKVFKNNDNNSNIYPNKKRESSFKIINKNKKNLSISIIHRNDIIKSKLKLEKYKRDEEKKNIENKILSKRKINKFIEKRQKSIDEIKTNLTSTNNSNKNININTSLTNNINNSYCNNIYKSNNNRYDLLKELFPNYGSLKINNDDSWYLKSIKNQLFKDKINYDLRKRYQFYEDLDNKRIIFDIPKLNIKKTFILCKHEIFPAKEPLHHKIYFDYVNKQRKKDNHSYEIKYNLLDN